MLPTANNVRKYLCPKIKYVPKMDRGAVFRDTVCVGVT